MTKTAAPTSAPVTPFSLFKTNTNLESEGIALNYSDAFWILIARAGGANEVYKRIVTEKFKPHRRAIETETIAPKVAERLLREAIAEGVVRNWGTGRYPEGAGFIPGPDGKPIGFSAEAVALLFEQLPDLYRDVLAQANNAQLFLAQSVEGDAKN